MRPVEVRVALDRRGGGRAARSSGRSRRTRRPGRRGRRCSGRAPVSLSGPSRRGTEVPASAVRAATAGLGAATAGRARAGATGGSRVGARRLSATPRRCPGPAWAVKVRGARFGPALRSPPRSSRPRQARHVPAKLVTSPPSSRRTRGVRPRCYSRHQAGGENEPGAEGPGWGGMGTAGGLRPVDRVIRSSQAPAGRPGHSLVSGSNRRAR